MASGELVSKGSEEEAEVKGVSSSAGHAASATMLSTDAPQLIEHVQKSVPFTPFQALWVPLSARFVVLGSNPRGTGALHVHELSAGELRSVHSSEKAKELKCGTFGASSLEERHLATGDYGGNVSIWDLERPELPVWSVRGHEGLVNAMDGCGGLGIGGGAPELVTGSRDGCVRLWDPRVKEAVLSLEPAEGESRRDCWTVCFGNSFSDSEREIAAGYDNGDVKIFDLRTSTLLHETTLPSGVVSLEYDRKDVERNKLVATTLESHFRLFDLKTMHPEKGFAFLSEKAHKSTVWLARHLPQNRDVFATTGGNGGVNLYRYKYPLKRAKKDAEGKMQGQMGKVELLNARVLSTQPIVSWDWHHDKEGLAVATCLDQTVRVLIVTKLSGF